MKRAIFLMFLTVLPAMAAEEGGHHGATKEGATKEGGAKKGGAPGTNVDMPFLMAPVTNEDGKLTGYAYISSRLTAASNGAALTAREKVPFIQDVFVRDVNSQQVTSAEHPDSVDIPALEARLLADARKVMGAGQVKTITVCTVQMTALKAKEPPARSPEQGAEGAPAEKSRCSN
jgi:hypothetical protein